MIDDVSHLQYLCTMLNRLVCQKIERCASDSKSCQAQQVSKSLMRSQSTETIQGRRRENKLLSKVISKSKNCKCENDDNCRKCIGYTM